jgi:hypothetical protein
LVPRLAAAGYYRSQSRPAIPAGRSIQSLDASEPVVSATEGLIRCGTHGTVRHAFICGHLVEQARSDTKPLVYYLADEADLQPDSTEAPCAWCASCDAVLHREGEWNDATEAAADIQIVCEFCFSEILAKNLAGDPDA